MASCVLLVVLRPCLSVCPGVLSRGVCVSSSLHLCCLTCDRSPGARAELWAHSCLILLVIFCQALSCRRHPLRRWGVPPATRTSGAAPVPSPALPQAPAVPHGWSEQSRDIREPSGCLWSRWWSQGLRGHRIWPGTLLGGDLCRGFCTAHGASLACGRRWEGARAIASARGFTHPVLSLVSQRV